MNTMERIISVARTHRGCYRRREPDVVPLLEDFNIPRAVRHIVSVPEDVDRLAFCYRRPDATARSWFEARMSAVKEFRDTPWESVERMIEA